MCFYGLPSLVLQGCNERRLDVSGEWAWLLQAFASQYGVRSNYAVMTHLRWVLRPGVASVSQNCFDLLARQLRPLLEQEAAGGCSLTQHEVSSSWRQQQQRQQRGSRPIWYSNCSREHHKLFQHLLLAAADVLGAMHASLASTACLCHPLLLLLLGHHAEQDQGRHRGAAEAGV